MGIYNVESMTINYDGGLSGHLNLRKSSPDPPPQLASGSSSSGQYMNWSRLNVTCPVPSGMDSGDLMVMVGGDRDFFASQPPPSITTPGWNTLISSEPYSHKGIVIGWKNYDGVETSANVSGGTSSSYVYITAGKIIGFKNARIGNYQLFTADGVRTISGSLQNPQSTRSMGRLVFGNGGWLDTGPGVITGGTGTGTLLVSDGNPPTGTWHFATSVMWDADATGETFQFDTANGDFAYMVVMEILAND